MTEENSLEILCRKHAYVPYQENAYTKDAAVLLENLNKSYLTYVQANNDNKNSELKAALDSLEDFNGGGTITSVFTKDLFQNNGSYEKIKELGEKLVAKKDTLKKVKQGIYEKYNREADLIYTLSNSLKALSELKIRYETTLKTLSGEINTLCIDRADQNTFDAYINKIIEGKASSEGIELSSEQRQKIRTMLVDEADKSLKNLCTNYLQLKNDTLVIENNVASYSSLAEGREGPLKVLGEFVRDMTKQIASFENILTFYQVYTKDELEYLSKSTFPPRFVDSVNRLSEHIDRVDKDSCRRALESLFSKKTILVKVPHIDVVVGGMIQSIGEEERKKSVIVVEGEPVLSEDK